LATDARAVLVSTGHPLAGLPEVSIEDVADYELLTLNTSGPRGFQEGWTPRHTPAGKPIRRAADDLAVMLGRDPAYLMDAQTTVARGHLTHLTIYSVLEHQPYAGLVVVPVPDLPPCVLAPVWHAERETAVIRAFVELAEQSAADLSLPGSAHRRPT
jgi:hypothetical protein